MRMVVLPGGDIISLIKDLKKNPEIAGILAGLLIIALLLPIWYFSGIVYEDRLIHSQKEQLIPEFALYSNSFENSLNQRIGLIDALYSFVITETEETLDEEFVRFASSLYSRYTGIRAVVIAPDGVFSYVYPPEGNDELIEYNLLKDPRPAVIRQNEYIFNGKSTILRGPAPLLSGEEGIVMTKGVFLNGTFEDGDF